MSAAQVPVFTVSQVNNYVKGLMDQDQLLTGLLVRGEISNYKCYPSGHHYFSLKDAQGSIRCVMFRGDAFRLRFRPANGMNVIAFGRVTVFPRDGQYQLYCSELMDDGQGALDRAFEELRSRLEKEGLFDAGNKVPPPEFPHKIALITSPAGAAVRDMIRILGARWPMAEVLVVPVRVQGEEAAGEIAAAIHSTNNRSDVDLIITGRGGGSREDLWAFNEEIVARAIFVSNIPVISAVGHEPDVTIADYVADVRASTPSNGAEIAVPDQNDMRGRIEHLTHRLSAAQRTRLTGARKDFQRLQGNRMLQDMRAPIDDRRMKLDSIQRDLSAALEQKIKQGRMKLTGLSSGLHAMSPLKVLGRGYAVARNEAGVISSVTQTQPGENIRIMLSDGELNCQVDHKEERTWQ